MRTLGLIANDWQLSGIWTGGSGARYDIGYSYLTGGANVNLTGSPSYAARVRIVGDPGTGCSDNQYAQFNTAAFAGPLTGSNGLESGRNYMVGCFENVLDLAVARTIRIRRLEASAIPARRATVKQTVAFSRFPSVFGTDRPKNAPTVPRNVPKGLCPEMLSATTQRTREVAFTAGGDGWDVVACTASRSKVSA